MRIRKIIKYIILFLFKRIFQIVLTKTEFVVFLAYFNNDFKSFLIKDFSSSRIGNYLFLYIFRNSYFKFLKNNILTYQTFLRRITATLYGDFSYASIINKKLYTKNPSNNLTNILYEINSNLENGVLKLADSVLFNKVVDNLVLNFVDNNDNNEFKAIPMDMFCEKSVCIIGPSCVDDLITDFDYYIYFGLPYFYNHRKIPAEKLILFMTEAKFKNISNKLKNNHKRITFIWSGRISSISRELTQNYNVFQSTFSGKVLDGTELIAGVELLLNLYKLKPNNLYITGFDLYLSSYNTVYLSFIHDRHSIQEYFNRSLSFIHNIDMQFILYKIIYNVLNIKSDIAFNNLMQMKLSDYLLELEKKYKITKVSELLKS